MKIRNIAAKTAAVLGCSALLALVPAIAGDHAAAGGRGAVDAARELGL